MLTFFFVLGLLTALLIGFVIGALVGIKDCKNTFGIPVGAVGVNDDGYIYP